MRAITAALQIAALVATPLFAATDFGYPLDGW